MKEKILTIGTFDGVHLGHQKLLGKMALMAKQQNLHSIVLTFDTHPYSVLNPAKNLRILTPASTKAELIRHYGCDEVIIFPFTEEFSHITALEFLDRYIISAHHPKYIVVGYDSHFGFKREGSRKFLGKHRKRGDFELVDIAPLKMNASPISSSLIRKHLERGDLSIANKLLGREYEIIGTVQRGKGIGKSLGFPTANIVPDESEQLLPRSGIYLCDVLIEDAQYFGLTNIGISPTLKSDPKPEIETYILDFDGHLYGRQLKIRFLRRLRDEKRFGSADALIDAMKADLKTAREIINCETHR